VNEAPLVKEHLYVVCACEVVTEPRRITHSGNPAGAVQ